MKATLIKKVDEARATKSFVFETEKEVSYDPGQYFYFTLPKLDYPDPRGETRHFTISYSPTEGKNLQITTRIREESGFKKTLDSLPIGTPVEVEGPTGTFILDESEPGPHVFIAGGIGITPFRSFIKYVIDKQSLAGSAGKGLKTQIHLIYSNSDSDFTFKKELEDWDRENENIKVDFIDSSKIGHLDEAMIKRLISDITLPTYWVVGPPLMVDAVEKILETMKISGNKIRAEKFTGY
ncbi:MAG: FAD-dependent oxidoreductase [Patescibacteria group bacterium]